MLHYATALRSTNLHQRRSAVRELSRMGTRIPDSALPFLIPLLGDDDASVRDSAADALASAGGAHPAALRAAVDTVASMLSAPEPAIRMRGIAVAARFGPAARALIPDLGSRLRDSNLIISRMAAGALTHVGAEALPTLQSLGDDADPHVRRQARWALQKMQGARSGVETQVVVRAKANGPAGERPTDRVPITVMPPSLQRTQVVPIEVVKPSDRRAQPRFACPRETFFRLMTDTAGDLWWRADIRDVSKDGIGMIASRKASAGARLTIDLSEADAGVSRQAVARVAHCRATPAGWHIGCRLVGSLLPDDLRRLRAATAQWVRLKIRGGRAQL